MISFSFLHIIKCFMFCFQNAFSLFLGKTILSPIELELERCAVKNNIFDGDIYKALLFIFLAYCRTAQGW